MRERALTIVVITVRRNRQKKAKAFLAVRLTLTSKQLPRRRTIVLLGSDFALCGLRCPLTGAGEILNTSFEVGRTTVRCVQMMGTEDARRGFEKTGFLPFSIP